MCLGSALMSPLKLSRTTAAGVTEEEVVLDPVPTEKAFEDGMDEVVRKHGRP